MTHKIKVDKESCIGCGSCVAICPEIFELDSEGKSRAKVEELEELNCAQQAIEACTVNCISVSK